MAKHVKIGNEYMSYKKEIYLNYNKNEKHSETEEEKFNYNIIFIIIGIIIISFTTYIAIKAKNTGK